MKDAFDAVGADDDIKIKRPARWPWLILLAALVGGGGYYGWQLSQAPEPLKVLLAFDVEGYWWEGSTAAARMTDDVADTLADLGFDPVRAGTPEVTEILEDAESVLAAAKTLKAAFVVSGRFPPQVNELPVADGYFEVRGIGDVLLQHQTDDAPQATLPITTWAGATDKDRALKSLGSSLATKTSPPLVTALLKHPTLRPLLQNKATGGDVNLLAKLEPARSYMGARNRALDEGTKAYIALGKRRDKAEKGPVPVKRHANMSADDGLAGTGPLGHLVKTEPESLYVSISSKKLYRLEGLETLEWRPDEGEAKILWSGYNVYSYPSVSLGGDTVMLVEDLYGWAKALTLIDAEGKSERLRIDPDQRYTSPQASPKGTYAAFYVRDCYKTSECPTRLEALRVSDGEGLISIEHDEGNFEGRAFADDKTLLFMHRSRKATQTAIIEGGGTGSVDGLEGGLEQPADTLWKVDLSASKPTPEVLWTAPSASMRTGWLTTSADGKWAAFSVTSPSDGIGLVDLSTGEMILRPVTGAPSAPRFSHDSTRITFNAVPPAERDEEVYVMPVSAGPAVRLTDNSFRDRYPHFGADGSRIYFESLDRDPNFRRRGVSVISSVPSTVSQ
ncbi:MAG: TolB family protein [Bradymonadia bacterium]